MAVSEAADFNQIIQAGRQRRDREALAAEIFSKDRRASAPNFANLRKTNQTPSLASRISGGITKTGTQRSSSASGFRPKISQAGNGVNNKVPVRPSSSIVSKTRTSQLENALSNVEVINQANVIANSSKSASVSKPSKGLTIRGSAGPFVVQASNLQSGTTAADIQNVLIDIAGPGNCKSCRIVTNKPTVIAEMVFAEKRAAESVIAALNNQIADGRTLHCFMKTMGGPQEATLSVPSQATHLPLSDQTVTSVEDAVVDPSTSNNGDIDMVENVDTTDPPYSAPAVPTGNGRRELFSQDRRDDRRADPEVQDGRYGFGAQQEREYYKAQHRQAQEETDQITRDEAAQKSSRYDERDRDRDRQRDYNRGSYPRRDNDSYRRGDDRYARGGYRRDDRPPHYSNGTPGGRGYDSRDRYGRMYSDSMMPPRRGGPRTY
ncbi:MAG: hypothetical protein Q9227_000931 [Pyrenula ochraceoflavens]